MNQSFFPVDFPGEMILDRSFPYGIKAFNGSLLFAGVVEIPAENPN